MALISVRNGWLYRHAAAGVRETPIGDQSEAGADSPPGLAVCQEGRKFPDYTNDSNLPGSQVWRALRKRKLVPAPSKSGLEKHHFCR